MLAVVGVFAIFCTVYGLTSFLPDLFNSHRTDFAAREKAYEWIDRNVPRDANVYAYEDPVLFLYTGRKACGFPIPPKFYYHGDDAAINSLMASMPAFARSHRLDYVLLTPDDYFKDLNAIGTRGLTQAMQSGAFEKLYDSSRAAVYKLNSPDTSASLQSGL
jgi:hypothetical protein